MKPKKHYAQAFEFGFVSEAFNLETQATQDGAKRQSEIDQAQADQAEATKRQLTINDRTTEL